MAKKKSNSGAIIFFILIMVVVIIAGYFVFKGSFSGKTDEPGEYDDFTRCMVDSGMKMYGSVTCSVCASQRTLFGNSFRLIDEIECSPFEDHSQAELCLEVGIEKTPTWIFEVGGVEVQRLEGYQTLETLARITGCSL